MGILDHMAILAEPLLSSHLSEASDFGLSLDRLLKAGLTVFLMQEKKNMLCKYRGDFKNASAVVSAITTLLNDSERSLNKKMAAPSNK